MAKQKNHVPPSSLVMIISIYAPHKDTLHYIIEAIWQLFKLQSDQLRVIILK